MATIQQKITPSLWFNENAEEAVHFYTSVFRNSKIGSVSRYGDSGPLPKGTLLAASFKLEGQEFVALNGGPAFSFTPAISFVVNCQTQEEIDYYWERLSADEAAEQCGWLKDKFGLSWQIVPVVLQKLLSSPEKGKAAAVMQKMMQMKRLIIADLENASVTK